MTPSLIPQGPHLHATTGQKQSITAESLLHIMSKLVRR